MMKTKKIHYLTMILSQRSNEQLMEIARNAAQVEAAELFMDVAKELYSRGVSMEDLKKLA